MSVSLLPLKLGSGVLSKQRRHLIWGGALLLGGLGSTAYSLLTYRGAELRTYLGTFAVFLGVFLIAALCAWLGQRRTEGD